jgi:hypothetical protein
MEFGKKGDARKAMMLHHRKGMSLKEAWKKVNKGKPKKEKKKTDAKKAKRDAKKAMMLHHEKGMSLKKAWKEVRSKFGDTVCPQGLEPNKKWTGKRGQRICIKECGFYQIRNEDTNRCRNMTILKPGYEINPATGKQRKICNPGYYRDPESGRCKKIKTSLEPLVLGYGKASRSVLKSSLGHPFMFGKKCGFGSCAACMN